MPKLEDDQEEWEIKEMHGVRKVGQQKAYGERTRRYTGVREEEEELR